MKKYFSFIVAVATMFAVTSCSQEEVVGNENSADAVEATFNVGFEGSTDSRAISDGKTVDQLYFAVYDADGNEIKALRQDDVNGNAVKVENNATLLTVTENGMAKRSSFDLYSTQSRGGKGTRTHKVTEKTGKLICATSVTDDNELFIATTNGQIGRINVDSIREAGKSTSGVKIINLAENDTVCSVSRNIKEQEEENVIETEE